MAQGTRNRITTRRARACAPMCVKPGDIEIQNFQMGAGHPLTGISFGYVEVACTLGDIGDPRFRMWLVSNLSARAETVHLLIVSKSQETLGL